MRAARRPDRGGGKIRGPRRLLALLGCLAVAGAAYLGHIGYLGGPIFTGVPATGVVLPAEHGMAAVLLSGDMGFKVGMGPQIAKRLAADGIPVLGINSLTYFRKTRTQAEAERLLAQAMERAIGRYHAQRLVLIGQSFGADVLHVGLARLPPAVRAKIALVALVVPGDAVTLRASPAELFDFGVAEMPALNSARALGWAPTICIRGAEEEHSLCPLLHQSGVREIVLPGGHPLRHDADALHRVLLAAIELVAAGKPPRAAAKPFVSSVVETRPSTTLGTNGVGR